MNNWIKKQWFFISLLVIFSVGSMFIVFAWYYLNDPVYVQREHDLPNYVTLIAEVMVGFVIAVTVQKISENNLKNIRTIIKDTKNLVYDQMENEYLQEIEFKNRIMLVLLEIKEKCNFILDIIDEYNKKPNDDLSHKLILNIGKPREIVNTQISPRQYKFDEYFDKTDIENLTKIMTPPTSLSSDGAGRYVKDNFEQYQNLLDTQIFRIQKQLT